MYNLPESFDPSFLLAKAIEQICFAQYHVLLCFGSKIWIQIEGKYILYCGSEIIESVAFEAPVSEAGLLQLIEKTVVDVSFEIDSGDITITFEDNLKLFIEGNIGPYESYRLCDGENEILV